MTSVSIIMPCYNQAYHLREVLEAYDHQSFPESFEVIAIDDASPDETYQVLTNYHPSNYQLRVLRQEINSGPAKARNLGIKVAQSPIIIFVGDDILPEATFVQDHAEAHKINPEAETAILGFVGWPKDLPTNSLMKHIDGIGAQQFSYHYLTNGQEYDFRHFYTANISVKHALLSRVKDWFDTDFNFAAYEDVEFSYRLSKQGMKILYLSKPVAYHYHYHNIWSFSERQYRAGVMALVLGNKHPNLRPVIMGKTWLPLLCYLGGMCLIRPVPSERAHLLEQSVLHLVSSYEWSPDVMTDWLYIRVLQHFYYKGIVQGFYQDTILKEKVLNYYITRSLTRILKWFSIECQRHNVRFPAPYEFLLWSYYHARRK